MGSPVNRASVNPAFDLSSDANDGKTATVQVGENNLSQVAARVGVDAGQLLEANPQISDPSKLQPGQDIFLPSSSGSSTPSKLEVVPKNPTQSDLPAAPISDPLTRNMVLSKLDAPVQKSIDILNQAGAKFVYADGDGSGSGSVTGTKTGQVSGPPTNAQACATESPDIKEALTNPPKGSPAKGDFAAAQKAIEAGDYAKAYQIMKTLIEVGPGGKPTNYDLPDFERKEAETMKNQLEFLSHVQKAGVKACYPPTEAELESYFKTLKNDPNGARQAFQDYAQNFVVHPVNINGADFEMKYSHVNHTIRRGNTDYSITTDTAQKWSDVSNHSVAVKDYPQYIGKQMNDCKGYAFMAEKLLGAAGFQVKNYVDVSPSKFGSGHMMVMFSHAGENKLTLTSNDGVFQGANQRELAKDGFAFAVGGKENLTGKEHFFTGRTGADAEVQDGVFTAAEADGVRGIAVDELPR